MVINYQRYRVYLSNCSWTRDATFAHGFKMLPLLVDLSKLLVNSSVMLVDSSTFST